MKTKWISGPVTKSIWVPGPVLLRRAVDSHNNVLWTMWAVSITLLSFWLVGMAAQFMMGGWIHALLAGSIIMGLVCAVYGFKHGGYFARPLIHRMRNPRFRRPM